MQKTQEQYFNMAVCNNCHHADINIKKYEWHYIQIRDPEHTRNKYVQLCPKCWAEKNNHIGKKIRLNNCDAIIKDKIGDDVYIQFKNSLVPEKRTLNEIGLDDNNF